MEEPTHFKQLFFKRTYYSTAVSGKWEIKLKKRRMWNGRKQTTKALLRGVKCRGKENAEFTSEGSAFWKSKQKP